MHGNTTAGVNGSPSLTITDRSSNEANSASPLKLRPSLASARMIPRTSRADWTTSRATSAPGTHTSLGGVRLPGVPLITTDCRWEQRSLQIRTLSHEVARDCAMNSWYAGRNLETRATPGHKFRDRVSFRVAQTQVLSSFMFPGLQGRDPGVAGPQRFGKDDNPGTSLIVWSRLRPVKFMSTGGRTRDATWLRRGIGYVIQDAGLFPHLRSSGISGLFPASKVGPRNASSQT